MVDNLVILPAVSSGELLTTRRRELGRSQRSLADLLCAISGRATVTRHEISRYEEIPGIASSHIAASTTSTPTGIPTIVEVASNAATKAAM